jgi:hypothetical protein
MTPFALNRHKRLHVSIRKCRDAGRGGALPTVSSDNLCHQAIFVDEATYAVMPPDQEMIQVGDAIWQRP